MVSKTADFLSTKAFLTVVSPPEKGRPGSYCGAIAENFNAVSCVDANVCTSGDPILFTIELSGATDASMVYAPKVEEIFRGTSFRLDAASLKTETLSAAKRFTWRVRAVGAGTVEIPAVDVAWFDLRSREYKTAKTAPIPFQIKAGEQATLGSLDEIGGETDEFPMPDGIDIPFSPRNFTLKHALSLAVKARTEKDFAAAAERYAMFVAAVESDKRIADEDDGAVYMAVHMRNLASLYLMAGKPREAIGLYSRSELITGSNKETIRGLKASYARLKNDPRADLPLPRILFPFWFGFPLAGRVISVVAAFAVFAVLFILALRKGRELAVIAVMCTAACPAYAWPFGGRSPFSGMFDDMPGIRMGFGDNTCPIKVYAYFSNDVTTVGAPVRLVVKLDPGTVKIAEGSVEVEAGFPNKTVYGTLLGNGDNEYVINATFLDPGTNDIAIAVAGAYSGSYTITNGNMISSGRVINQSFKVRTPDARIVVNPLPEEGRPLDYSGAVGRNFKITQKLIPEKVHPGDLVTAEYRLAFDGYCPSNAVVRIDNLSREFKSYEIKEIQRDSNSIVWHQMIVPRTVQATNSALVSFSYYDLRAKRYARTKARPAKLTFVSAQKASTENRKVSIVGESAIAACGNDNGIKNAIVLHYAPHADSPTVVTLPPGTIVRETGKWNGWRRVESDRGSGWMR